MSDKDYTKIDEPYNSLLERSETSFGNVGNVGGGGAGAIVNNPGDINPGSITGQALDDLLVANWIKARDYAPKKAGFYIDGRTGYAEFVNVYITGEITATSGTIGGWTVSATSIKDTAGVVGLSSAVTGGDDIRFWAGHATPASAPFKVTESGALTSTNATITGAVTINSGSGIANLSDAGALATANTADFATQVSGAAKPENNATVGANWSSNLLNIPATLQTPSSAGLYLSSTYLGYYSGSVWNAYIDNGGNFYFKGDANSSIDWNITTPSTLTIKGKVVAGTGSSIATSYLSGSIAQANLNIADRGWTQTCVFSVTDADTVAWGAGTFTSADGTAYSIDAGNTGNMVAKTYIYLDTAVSTTAYQTTTTATTAVGAGKVLVAIAQNGTGEATFQVLQGQGGQNIDAANIVAGSITANEIAASTITAGKMSVTQLSAIAANLGTVTAGTLTGITVNAEDGGVNFYDGATKRATVKTEGNDIYFQLFDNSGIVRQNIWIYAASTTTQNFDPSVVDTTGNLITLQAAAYAVFKITATEAIFTSTGALPSPLVAGTTYYTRDGGANQIKLYPTSADAVADTNQIDLTTQGSGTHTIATVPHPAIYSTKASDLGTSSSPWVAGYIKNLQLNASSATLHPLNIPAGTDPTTPASGDIWFLSSKNLRFHDGTESHYIPMSTAATGGVDSAGAGKQYIELEINGNKYKVLHDGTV